MTPFVKPPAPPVPIRLNELVGSSAANPPMDTSLAPLGPKLTATIEFRSIGEPKKVAYKPPPTAPVPETELPVIVTLVRVSPPALSQTIPPPAMALPEAMFPLTVVLVSVSVPSR